MQKVNLDLIPGGVAPIVYASQYDDGRVIRFMLTSGGSVIYILSASEVITCNLTKPDGTETVIDVANPGAGKNYVDLVNGADDYDQEGVYSGEIVLTRNSTVEGTANFILKVEADAYDGQVTTDTATGNPCTFDTDLADNLVSLTAEIVASGGGGTPSTPIPIVGYSSANITRCGVNLWDEEWELGDISSSNGQNTSSTTQIRTKNYISVVPGVQYYSKVGNIGTTPNLKMRYYDKNKNFIDNDPVSYPNQVMATIPNDCYYIRIVFPTSYGTTYNNDISINSPATDTTYHAYNGQTYTIAFGQTVYGGVLDVTRGKLRVTHGYVDLGSLTWTAAITNVAGKVRMRAELTHKAVPNNVVFNAKCDIYNAITASETYICVDGISGENTGNYIFVYDSNYSTTADVPAFSSMVNGHYLTYELATPFDIDLTPVQISALVGTNNITSDVGGDVSVTYIKKA